MGRWQLVAAVMETAVTVAEAPIETSIDSIDFRPDLEN